MSTIYATATTLDGRIADVDHSLDWLLSREQDPDAPGFDVFLSGVGAQVMGASTWEWLVRHAGADAWPYAAPTWVLTHRADRLAADRPAAWAGADVRFADADDDDALRALHAQLVESAAGRHVWVVGGGEIAGRLADLGLLDEVHLDLAPCTLGDGAPLLPRRVELALRSVRANGELVHAQYVVVRPDRQPDQQSD